MNFWDQTHPLSADYDRLNEQLVPVSGMCDTLQGEMLRAASKIGYDWYNNGWGCNNWSGAVVFLENNATFFASKRTPEEVAKFKKALAYVSNYSHGEDSSGVDDDRADQRVTTIVAFVVQNILDNPAPIVNTIDMWSLSEPDARYEDEEEDYWGEEEEED